MFKLFPYLIVLIAFFFLACENDMQEVEKFSNENLEPLVETAKGIKITYSEVGEVKVEIESPKVLMHKGKEAYDEFPDGLKVTFYDDTLGVTSVLVADFGIRYEKKQEVELRDNVVFTNNKGEKLETDELFWNEKTRKIHSDKFCTISTSNSKILAEGFEANQDFTQYKIKKIKDSPVMFDDKGGIQ